MSLADALGTILKADDSALSLPSEANDVLMNPNSSDHDGEDDLAQDPDEDMQDLFGEDADNKLDESTGHSDQGDLSESERRHREAMEYPEDDEAEPMVEQVANVSIPNIPVPRSSDGKHWVLRMPNFVKVDSKPFHPETYVGPEQEDEELTAESLREKSMSIKLKVENTVRWKWVKDEHGQDQRQSNARVVRWSDGTLSLKLGKELFDITQTVDTSGAVQRQALGLTQSQSQASVASQALASQGSQKPLQAQGLTYLVAQHKRSGILQCEALVTGYMSLRPTGMQSETHRMLVRAVGQKHNKVARLRMAPDPTMDPEREMKELLKIASKKSKRTRGSGMGGDDDGFGGGASRRRRQSYSKRKRTDDVWSDDDDDDAFGVGGSDDDFGIGGGGGGRSGGHGDDRRKRHKSQGGDDVNPRKGPGEYQTDDFLVSDSEEEGDHDDDEDDSDDVGHRRRKHKTRKNRRGGAGGSGAGAGDVSEEDDLEKLDAKIDQQAAEERKRRQGGGGGGGGGKQGTSVGDDEDDAGAAAGVGGGNHGNAATSASASGPADLDDAMDVESEEEEEQDVAVRRAGTAAGSRKKRAIDLEEEDDE